MGTSIYQISRRMAVPQTAAGYDPYSRAPMGSAAMSAPSLPENPPAPIAMMFPQPPVPENPPAPVARVFPPPPPPPAPVNPPAPITARCPPPLPTSIPSSRSNPPPIPAPPVPASVPSSRSNPPPIPAPLVPTNPSAGSAESSASQVSANKPSSDRIYGYYPVDSSNSGSVHLSTSVFPELPNVPTNPPSGFVRSPLEMPELPTVPSSTPNREEVASSEAM